jgi:hypothetical protein
MDLDKKLMRYIRQCNKQAAPLKSKYPDPTRRIRRTSSGSTNGLGKTQAHAVAIRKQVVAKSGNTP